MDRRIHNAIKLSAAVFLLNACGFAAKNNSHQDETQNTPAPEQKFAFEAAARDCYTLQDAQPTVAGIDENADLFTYGHPPARVLKTSGPVVQSDSQVIVSRGNCF